ncbi:MAG: TerB family tellurite resistance protein, partial [Desulfuromonadales bacterium]
MFNRIMSLLQAESTPAEESRFERVQVATCALLLEVAHSDGHYKSVEAKIVHELLANTFNLPPEAVTELIDYSHQHRQDSTDLFQFAREINAHFSREEKADVMEG